MLADEYFFVILRTFKVSFEQLEIYSLPPLLVQRCNGITAGLGYLEVLELPVQILLLGQLASVRTVNSLWGRRYNSTTDLSPITNSSIQLQCVQARSPHPADKTTGKPQAKCCM